jgi:glycerate kinase
MVMNILIAPDSFKDCLPACEVARYLENGLKRVLPDASIRKLPVADGGEGTVTAVLTGTGGRWVDTTIMDPLFREIPARYAITGDGSTAVIEMAAASGIELLKLSERDPLKTTTFGTGQLIRHALDQGCRTLLLGIGGSATNDSGMGMAAALGILFLDSSGQPVEPVGGNMGSVRTIQTAGLDPRIKEARILVACDVQNPLTGPLGASLTYGLQKGGDPGTLLRMDRDMQYFASLIRAQLGKDVEKTSGSGAAGGLGAGLMAFLDAELGNGFEMVSRITGLEKAIMEADLVITGEGKIDRQSLQGKAPFGVARLARKHGKSVFGVAGLVQDPDGDFTADVFDLLLELREPSQDISWSIQHAPGLLEKAGEKIAEMMGK